MPQDVDSAISSYSVALEIDPSYSPALAALGHVYLATNRPADAVPYLKKAMKLEPADTGNMLNLGAALKGSGDIAGDKLPTDIHQLY